MFTYVSNCTHYIPIYKGKYSDSIVIYLVSIKRAVYLQQDAQKNENRPRKDATMKPIKIYVSC